MEVLQLATLRHCAVARNAVTLHYSDGSAAACNVGNGNAIAHNVVTLHCNAGSATTHSAIGAKFYFLFF
jgi:hypothetical protein